MTAQTSGSFWKPPQTPKAYSKIRKHDFQVGGMRRSLVNPPRQGSARRQRRVRSLCPRQNAKLTSCLYAMTTALRNQAFMTKVTTTYSGALHSLNAMPLRGEGDPGEPYPLNNSPFPNSPGSHHLRKVLFSLVFFTIYTENRSFSMPPEVSPLSRRPQILGGRGYPQIE